MTQKRIEAGNTTVELVEENGVVTVRILSNDAVVYMNDDLIWSKGNDKEEFKYIPHKFHDFILNSGADHIEFNSKAKETVVDLYIHGYQASFYFPMNQKTLIHARFDFALIDEIKMYLDDLQDEEKTKPYLEEAIQRFNKTKELAESKGFKFTLSHDMGEWAYAWYDVVFSVSNWDEEAFGEIMKEVAEFNGFLNRMRDELKF